MTQEKIHFYCAFVSALGGIELYRVMTKPSGRDKNLLLQRILFKCDKTFNCWRNRHQLFRLFTSHFADLKPTLEASSAKKKVKKEASNVTTSQINQNQFENGRGVAEKLKNIKN